LALPFFFPLRNDAVQCCRRFFYEFSDTTKRLLI
jgi:hypothetical protein